MSIARVGIVGAGQLGRMLALSGYPIGVACRVLDSAPDAPGAEVAKFLQGELGDIAALRELASTVDVVTLEIENVNVDALETLGREIDVFPPPPAIAASQDRLAEKTLFRSLGIPTAEFVPIGSPADAEAAEGLGWPVILKTRHLGYDGRGQRFATSVPELVAAWRELGSVPSIAEARIRFEREVSLIAVRGADAQTAFYPLTENVHVNGILSTSVAPFEHDALQRQAQQWLEAILAKFDYRGVLTVEFFHTAGGLVANEMAPRVHNSGHWTIEGAETSQFENHLRAVLGWPLGSTRPRGHAAMLNLIGTLPDRNRVLALPGAHLHDYGKSARPGRKVGHCTLVDSDKTRLLQRLDALKTMIST